LTGSLILRLKNIGNFYLIGGERINGDKIIINPFFIICNVESWRRLQSSPIVTHSRTGIHIFVM
ncbi:MAG: hypothetical protein SOX26_10825, partial [Phocaeicola sp.]|nr:hypothetical protein [Phocaeicola sp.]